MFATKPRYGYRNIKFLSHNLYNTEQNANFLISYIIGENIILVSDFIWDFRNLPYPSHLGKYFIKIGKISAKIHEIRKIKPIFGLGMTPI